MPTVPTTVSPSRWTNTRFELMDPRDILLDQNKRTIDDIEKENPDLVHSVGEHGVLQPAIVHPTADGRIRMHDGHQRALATIVHIDKHPVMPVIVTDLTDDRAHAWLRDMWIFNQQRRSFSSTEQVEILDQMALDGLTDEEIATQLSLPADTVKAGRRVYANEMARRALGQNAQLTFEQADAFAEFADDPEACDRLNTTLDDEPEIFDHVVSELRQERATHIARDEMIEKLRADDVHILEQHELATANRLSNLYQDKERQRLLSDDLDAHKRCGGHAARVTTGVLDGEPRVEYWCRNWASHGHVGYSSTSGGGVRSGQRTATENAENRRVIANNKQWLAAIPVRRKKLAELLAKDELPTRVQQQMAIAVDEGSVAHTSASKALACDLLGFKTKRGRKVKLATKLRRASANRATVINLALLLASFEVAYDLNHTKDTWRSPTTNDQVYFRLLRDWKIPMNMAERLVLDPDADKKDWPHLQSAAAPGDPTPDVGPADDTDESEDRDDTEDVNDELDDEQAAA